MSSSGGKINIETKKRKIVPITEKKEEQDHDTSLRGYASANKKAPTHPSEIQICLSRHSQPEKHVTCEQVNRTKQELLAQSSLKWNMNLQAI